MDRKISVEVLTQRGKIVEVLPTIKIKIKKTKKMEFFEHVMRNEKYCLLKIERCHRKTSRLKKPQTMVPPPALRFIIPLQIK